MHKPHGWPPFISFVRAAPSPPYRQGTSEDRRCRKTLHRRRRRGRPGPTPWPPPPSGPWPPMTSWGRKHRRPPGRWLPSDRPAVTDRTERSAQPPEILRRLGLDALHAAVRVRELQGQGVQHQPRNLFATQHQRPAVAGVPGDRPADGGQVHAQLMHAPGVGLQLQQGRRGALLHRPVGRPGALRVGMVARADPHIGLASLFLPAQGRLDHPIRWVGRARRDDRPIGLRHPPRHDRLAKRPGRRLGLGRHDHAGGIAVQPMHQLGPLAVGAGEGPQQLVQRMELPPPALARQPCRLVQRKDGRVLVDHHRPHEGDLVGREGDGLARHEPFLVRSSAQRSFAPSPALRSPRPSRR